MHIPSGLIRTGQLFTSNNERKHAKQTSLPSIQNNRNVSSEPNLVFPLVLCGTFWQGMPSLLPGLLALFVSVLVLRKSPLVSWSDWAAEPSVRKELGQLCFIAGYLLPWPNQITSLIAQFLYLQHRNGHVFLNPSQWPVNEKHSTCTIIIIISEVILGVMTAVVCKVTGEKQRSSLKKECVFLQATVV